MPFPPGPNLSGEGVCLPRFNPFYTQLDAIYALAQNAFDNAWLALSMLSGSTTIPNITVNTAGFVCIDDGKTVLFRVRIVNGNYTLEPFGAI